MNFNATLIALFVEAAVVAACLWLFFTYLKSRDRLKSRTHQNLSVLLIVFGSTLICTTFLINILSGTIVDPYGTRSPSLGEFLSLLGISAGCLCIVYALVQMLKQLDIANARRLIRKTGSRTPHVRENSDQFQAIFIENPANFLIIDAQQRVADANYAIARLLESKVEQLNNEMFRDLVLEEDRPLLKNLTPEKIRTKGFEYAIDLRLNHHDSDPMWVKITPRVIDIEGKGEGLLLNVQDIRETKNLAELIAFHSQYDELTMLHNREGLENYLARELETAISTDQQIALIYVDVDQIKVVNDTCGHAAGDRLLQHLVTVIGQSFEERDFFARVGGDEFALIKLNSCESEAKEIAERIRSAAEDFVFVWRNNTYRQSISVGVALSSPTITSVIDLIGAADSSCYTAKENGKNRVVMYSESIDTSNDNRRDMMWVSRLQKAIQDGDFELYFQPIEKLKQLRSSQHVHYELLIRYVDEQGRHIPPQHFLPAVERFGLSEQIDLWVLTTALDYLDKHPHHTEILDCCSINLTSQSIANPRIRSAILQVVQSYDFPREKICFEITESSAIHNLKEAQEFVNELKTLGCHLALDDFGTGFSSFGYLKHLEVDYIKIDGSFVRDIITDRFDRAMVSAINNIGKEMDIAIIAEYAETTSILKTLYNMDVDFAQGHAIAKPMPIYQLESYYRTAETAHHSN